jgi:hypothetical protein
MSSKSVVSRRTPIDPRVGRARRSPEIGQKLKSERVQVEFQLASFQQEARRALDRCGANALAGATVTLSFDVPAQPVVKKGGGAGSANGEAGPAFGAHGLIEATSTQGEEADHADA